MSRKTCRRKVKHASRLDAEETCRKLTRSGKLKAHELIAYECPVCKSWHLGHPSEQMQDARKKILRPTQKPIIKMNRSS